MDLERLDHFEAATTLYIPTDDNDHTIINYCNFSYYVIFKQRILYCINSPGCYHHGSMFIYFTYKYQFFPQS